MASVAMFVVFAARQWVQDVPTMAAFVGVLLAVTWVFAVLARRRAVQGGA